MAKFSVGGLEDGEGPSSLRDSKGLKRARQHQPNSGEEIPQQHQQPRDQTHELGDLEEEHQEFLFDEECREFRYDDEDEEQESEQEEQESEQGEEKERASKKALLGGPSRNEPISFTVTDPEVFDCPICCEPLATPVFQCENGHLACSTCCTKLQNKCPSCCLPIGYNRCRAIEKVLESVKVMCQNKKYGCKETVSYGKKHDHEKTCLYAPCSCPLSTCNFVGSSSQLYKHFSRKHRNCAVHFSYNEVVQISLNVNSRFLVLQEERDGVLFILTNNAESLGNVISVSCVAPSGKAGYLYDILTIPEGNNVQFQAITKNIQNWVDQPPSTGFLLLPLESFGPSGHLQLELLILNPFIPFQHVPRLSCFRSL